jgi:hypothetical protein
MDKLTAVKEENEILKKAIKQIVDHPFWKEAGIESLLDAFEKLKEIRKTFE